MEPGLRAKSDETSNCQTQLSSFFGTVLKSVSSSLTSSAGTIAKSVGSAISQSVKKVFTSANITSCVNCTAQKIEDEFDGNDSNCGGGSSSEKNTKKTKTGTGTGNNKSKVGSGTDSGSTSSQNNFLDYPSNFDQSKMYSPPTGNADALRKRWSARGR